jgi:hypothetical protein
MLSLPVSLQVHGGTIAPYGFVDLDGKSSWDMFSKIPTQANIHPFSSPTLTRAIAHPLFSLQVHGGTNAPYVFVDLDGKSSWDMFSKILEEANVVTIPGAGFGPGGEGFLRLSAFASRASTEEACERLAKVFG